MPPHNTPEPLSKPVDSMSGGGANVPPASMSAGGASSTPLGQPTPNVGRAGRGGRIFRTLIFLIVLGAAGYFGYQWYLNRGVNVAGIKADKEAADKKVADLEKQVTELKAAASPSPTPSPSPKPDAEAIAIAAKAYAATLAAYKADTAVFGTPKISTKDTKFASVSLSTKGETGGSSMILKKVDGTWVVIVAGLQNTVSATDKTLYGIPTDMP